MDTISNKKQAFILIYAKKHSQIKKALSEDSYTLAFAKDATDVLQIYQEKQPDLLLLDDNALCKQLSTNHQANILFIGRVNQIEEAFSSGAIDCYIGAIRPTLLKKRIANLLKASNSEIKYEQGILADALRENIAKISSTLDLNEVFLHMLSAIKTLVPYDGANIMLIENQHVKIEYTLGYEINLLGSSYPIEEFPDFARILDTHEPFYIPDTSKFEGWKNFDSLDWIKSNLSVPIAIEDKIIGFLNLDSSKTNGFTENHIQWLITFANQASIAIRNARYTSELEKRVQERNNELESETAQLQAILNAMRDGLIYSNIATEIQYINQALQDLTGYEEEVWLQNIAQEKVRTYDPAELAAVRAEVDDTLRQKGYWRGETALQRKDGSRFEAELTRTIVKNKANEAIGRVTVIRDISDKKRLEEQKRRFIATAAHELRTPIANLKTRLFLMRQMPEKFAEHLAVSESVINLMQNLVEEMFDLGRFEHGTIKLEREDVILQNLLKEIIQYQKPEAERQHITLSTYLPDSPISIFADPYRLTQVIINLVGNALRHTKPNGSICVVAKTTATDVLLKVTDSGEGISSEHIDHLFEPFYRINNDKKGAGLGLTIVQEIVSLHGGTIDVESKVGKGTSFTIKLPLEKLVSQHIEKQPETDSKQSDTSNG